ncbi:MAG TPA: SusC/RagA family TonB-linked outer membrane protein [Chitinophagaceae bacterium]|nr:SusC/RagA family TonB-linked outer membrane protein [Chitinophagaceae bacterium]
MTKTRLLRALMLCSLFLLIIQQSWAQTKTVSGTVTDDKGAAIVGASVLAKGTQAGTSTDVQGAFKLTVPSGATTLVISYVGFADKEVDITSTTSVQVSLVPQAGNLSDVVVVGYGTQKKKDVTGAVASISSKDFNAGSITDPMQQIQGKVSGLVITQAGGDPNQQLIIRLRGQSSLTGSQTPLIVVDGVPLSDPNQVANIPPGDIASYDILKDASAAAVYGSRAANGVIIINTKKATAGTVKVEYSGYGTVDNVAKKYPLLNASEWKSAAYNYLIQTGSTPDDANNTIKGYDLGANTDWQDAITRTAYTHNHNLAISGGTAHFNLRGSVSYLNQEGVVMNSGKEGLGLRLNGEGKALNDKLDIQFGIENTSYNRKYTDYGALSLPLFDLPTFPVRNADGSYYPFIDFAVANPVMHLDQEINTGKENLTIMKGQVDYTLIPGLKIGSLSSYSHFNKQVNWFQPAFPVENNFNNAHEQNYNTDLKTIDAHVYYNTAWGLNNLGVSAVYEFNSFENDNFYAGGQQYLVEENQNNNLGGGNSAYNGISSYKESYIIKSYVGRITYNYNSKYYATATIRRDGSSKFGVNNRWGNFPSFDLAWAVSREKFMENIKWINNLKLRAGYGVTGNSDAINPYSTLFLLSSGARYYNPGSANFQYPFAYSPSQNANPDLKWEERHGKNIGVDFSLFNYRLTGDIDYFNDKTKNLLYNYTVPVPPFFINTILANVGDLTNKGLEIALTGNVVKGRRLNWDISGQISFIKTKVTNLSGTYQSYKVATDNIPGGYAEGRGLSSNPITFLKVGYAPYTFYLPHYVSTDKDGNQLFDDGKGGTTTDPTVKNYYIDPSPKFQYGITNTFTYDNWSLNFFLRGVSGQKIFNNTELNEAYIKRLPGNNVFSGAVSNPYTSPATASDLYLQNGSYLRLDNATLAYTFNKIKGVDYLKVYVSGNNLFVITKYKGLDPEIRNGNTNEAYIDATYGGDAYYYRTRSISLGVNISFQ